MAFSRFLRTLYIRKGILFQGGCKSKLRMVQDLNFNAL